MDRKRGVWGKERFGETDAASVLGPFTRVVKMGPPGADVRRTAGETEGSSKRAVSASPSAPVTGAHPHRHTGAVSHAPLCVHHLSQCQTVFVS